MKQIGSLGVLLLLVHGCCGIGLTFDPPGHFAASQGPPDLALYEPEGLLGVVRGLDVELDDLEAATYATVTGPTFRAWLGAAVELFDGAVEHPTGAQVLDDYLARRGRGPGAARPKRHVVVLDGAARGELADTAIGVRGHAATVMLRSPVLERWQADSVEARGCAINTVAHEWTHLVTTTGAISTFQDRCHAQSTVPLVSYTVGAIAQCAYLAEHAGSPIDLAACVAAVGTTEFDTSSCDAGWAAAMNPAVAPADRPRRAEARTIALCTEGAGR